MFQLNLNIKLVSKVRMEEQELAERCKRGDRAAYQELYVQYAGRLLSICLRYIGDRETACDVLHDGFLRIYQSIGQFKYQGQGSLKAWLSRVMVNEALGYLRKHVQMAKQEVLVEEVPDMADEHAGVSVIPRKALMRMIRELPDGYRTVFNLYVFEEKSHKEIANILGITEHTSSSQFYRAKMLMARKIKEYRKEHNS